MTDCKRTGKRWTTSEVLNLQREYELLEWNVQQIADKHERSVQSILFKLFAEGLTSSLYEATGYSIVTQITDLKVDRISDLKRKKNQKIAELKGVNQNKPLAKLVAKVTRKNVVEDEDEVMSDTDSSSDFDDDDISEYKSDDDVSVDKNVNTLSDRVWSLETSVGEINTMVKQMFDQMTKTNTKKLAPLRKLSTFRNKSEAV